MLHDARMAETRKLQRGIDEGWGCPVWAVRDGQNDAWQAGDAAARKAGQSPERSDQIAFFAVAVICQKTDRLKYANLRSVQCIVSFSKKETSLEADLNKSTQR
jgi:hypothetical protein